MPRLLFGRALVSFVVLTMWLASAALGAYPLDGYESTGIARLLHQRGVQEGQIGGKKRPAGELLALEQVRLRLLDQPELDLPSADAELTGVIKRLLGPQADRYGIALLDLSDVDHPRYAVLNGATRQNPGSVGKVLVGLAIFQALADIYPNDIEARKRVLTESVIVADAFSVYDHHTVRFFDPDTKSLVRRPIAEGDAGTMYTYLDWMMSPSSNSAAGMLQKHLILLSHFGRDYPVSREEEIRFFEETPRKRLSDIFNAAIQTPVTRNRLNLEELRQGSFFTRGGKKRVDGTSSYATARELIRFLVRMEQGKLVDEWSSLELKRLLYITERRIRYGSSGALRSSAVYFKSGSLYSCVEEAGFTCKKYHGNKRNYMNSLAIIETPAGQERLYYMVTVLSNVLRKNSAQDHRDLARAIHGRLLEDHPEKASAAAFGEGFIGYEQELAALRLKTDTQEALLTLGYDIGEIDGVIGPATRGAISEFQSSQGLAADGEPTATLLELMRKTAREKGLARPFGSE